MTRRRRIYLASPLFSDSEKSTNEMLAQIMQRWCDVFLPQRDGHLLPNLIATGASPEAAYRHVFERDITAVNACDAIVINLDGRTVDEGAAFELGYAHALGKLCVGYRTDSRVLLQWGLNPMISVPLVHIMRTPSELDEWARSLAESRADDRPRLAVA